MRAFLLRRLAGMLLVWVGVTILTFFIANVVPSDPVALRLGPKASPEIIEKMRHEFGLDLPLHQQYLNFLKGLLKGDLGNSIWSGRPVLRDLQDYLPATLELGLTAFLVTIIVGISLGLWASTTHQMWLDHLIQLFATFGLAVPLFWLGMVLQILFYLRLGALPLDSRIDLQLGPPEHLTGLYIVDSLLQGDFIRLTNSLKHLILPVVTLSLPSIGATARMTRASMLEVLSSDYIRTARSKGASNRRVFWRHALQNALIPVVTLLGNTANALLAGTFVVEVIFNWPGIGWYATKVILASDYVAVISITLVIAVICTTINLIVDIFYRILDPRIQLR
jgi:peptide/nickel transport system permease protein